MVAAKKAGRSRRRGASELDDMTVPGNVEPEVIADGVAIKTDGHYATFWPVSFDRLPAETRQLAELVGEWVATRRELSARIDATVDALRDGGMSWGQIGFLVGYTDEGARQRWGENSLG